MDKTAEEKWRDHARKFEVGERGHLSESYTAHIAEDYLLGIEDFKQALRERIEKMLEPYDSENIHPRHFPEKEMLQKVLELIDQVEPLA